MTRVENTSPIFAAVRALNTQLLGAMGTDRLAPGAKNLLLRATREPVLFNIEGTPVALHFKLQADEVNVGGMPTKMTIGTTLLMQRAAPGAITHEIYAIWDFDISTGQTATAFVGTEGDWTEAEVAILARVAPTISGVS